MNRLVCVDCLVELATKSPQPYPESDWTGLTRIHLRITTKAGQVCEIKGRLDPVGVAPLLSPLPDSKHTLSLFELLTKVEELEKENRRLREQCQANNVH